MTYRYADQSDNVLPRPAWCANGLIPIGRRIWFWERAGGDCVCGICGRKFYDHPPEMDPDFTEDCGYSRRVAHLNVLCNGERVKL